MLEIKAYIRPALLDHVIDALGRVGGPHGVAVVSVQEYGHATDDGNGLVRTEMVKLEINAQADSVEHIVNRILSNARSGEGHPGDGLVTLCRHHHRAVHEGGFDVQMGLTGCRGSMIAAAGSFRKRRRCVSAETCVPDWHGEGMDEGLVVEALYQPES